MGEEFDICRGAENIPIYVKGGHLNEQLENFVYVCCNIPAPGLDTTPFEETILGCKCQLRSCMDNCSCIQRSNGLAYNESSQLKRDYFSSDSGAIFECNSSCSCSEKCQNRTVQNGIHYRLEVFTHAQKGMSLRTLVPILSNTFVCEYAGEILTATEAERRFSQQTQDDMNYIFILKEHCKNETIQTIVDPKLKGNIGRFLNHSCEPNLRLVPVRIHTMVPRLCLFASRDIDAGEELTYDYSSGEAVDREPGDSDDLSDSRKPCHCNTKLCKGYLPLDKSV